MVKRLKRLSLAGESNDKAQGDPEYQSGNTSTFKTAEVYKNIEHCFSVTEKFASIGISWWAMKPYGMSNLGILLYWHYSIRILEKIHNKTCGAGRKRNPHPALSAERGEGFFVGALGLVHPVLVIPWPFCGFQGLGHSLGRIQFSPTYLYTFFDARRFA